MTKIKDLKPALSTIAVSTGLAGGLFFTVAPDADAQDTAPSGPAPAPSAAEPTSAAGVIALPAVRVGGETPTMNNTLETPVLPGRLPGTVQDTPQTITVIPHIMIEQQQATTVDQVLQYVPGITVSTGEGNGGITGDQFRIRGFDASGDIYLDGLRDFGTYVRDDFNTENVSVLKGPSSESFGNGSSGGVIELQSKKAHLGNRVQADASAGSASYGRGVLDYNQQIGSTTAFRVVGMLHTQDVVDRDYVYSNRWGILASAGFGLGSDHSVTLNYFHQQSNRRPDFGVPLVGEPVTELGVPRSNFFGRSSDRALQSANVISLLYTGHIRDWLTVTNSTRFGAYGFTQHFSPVFCFGAFYRSTCQSGVLHGNLNVPYTIWQVGGNSQTSYGGENVTTADAKFHVLGLKNELVGGIDVYSQHANFNFFIPTGPEPVGTLLQPVFYNSPGFSSYQPSTTAISATSWDVGPFISDRLWLLPSLSIMGGTRWDNYEVNASSEGAPINKTTRRASPKASLIWEPTKHQTYYFNFARAFVPPGSNITSLSTNNGLVSGSSANSLSPQITDTYEVGAKIGVFDDRLGLTAAAFRVDRGNTLYNNPASGVQTATGDTVRIQGFEAGATGNITPNWNVQASYTYMDGQILTASITNFNPVSTVGKRAPYVSRNSASLWTTYDLTSLTHLPGHLVVGGGFNYRGQYYADNAMTLRIPAAVTADAMASYDVSHYHLALNVTNLTNALAYSSAFTTGYATPVPGRTFIGTIGLRY